MKQKLFRKKPVVIEAMGPVTDENAEEIAFWCNGIEMCEPTDVPLPVQEMPHCVVIETLEGSMTASRGDYVIRGVAGEFYPCKPDIFDATYEPA